MLDWEFRVRPFAWLKRDWSPPVLLGCGFGLWWFLFYLPWAEYEIDWIGWAQAAGSIGAVAAAIWVSSSQARRERTERHSRECGYMLKARRAAFTGACSAQALAGCAESSPFDYRAIRVYLDELRESLFEVEKFNNSELADVLFSEHFMVQKRAMRLLISEVETYLDERDVALLVGFKRLSEWIHENYAELQERVSKYADAVGIELDALITP